MAHTKGDKDDLGWLSKLHESSAQQPDTVPEGWMTVSQCAKKLSMSESHTSKMLRLAVDDGAVETRKFRIDAGSRLYPTAHFKWKT